MNPLEICECGTLNEKLPSVKIYILRAYFQGIFSVPASQSSVSRESLHVIVNAVPPETQLVPRIETECSLRKLKAACQEEQLNMWRPERTFDVGSLLRKGDSAAIHHSFSHSSFHRSQRDTRT